MPRPYKSSHFRTEGHPAYAHPGHLVLNNREHDAHRNAPNRRKSDAGRGCCVGAGSHDNGSSECPAMQAAIRRRSATGFDTNLDSNFTTDVVADFVTDITTNLAGDKIVIPAADDSHGNCGIFCDCAAALCWRNG